VQVLTESYISPLSIGYKVVTVTDCVAATSMEANQAAIGFTFPMFSIPLTSADLITKL
jgi:nicotinamidase-related amidase